MKRFSVKRQRGSALLIVLGFLTFMTISAVSFAIYMRVERQATSNYRHSLVSRHILETALNRAISEVDCFGLHSCGSRKEGSGGDQPVYNLAFPPATNEYDSLCGWLDYGRIYNSWSAPALFSEFTRADLGLANPVSLEALCHVPALFLNDLRYYCQSNTVNSYSASVKNSGSRWTQLSLPVGYVQDPGNHLQPMRLKAGSTAVGRYAYTCLNVSDFININRCTLGNARDTRHKRVSVYQLLEKNTGNISTNYSSILDFNATQDHNNNQRYNPAYDWLRGSYNRVAEDVYKCKKHLFVTQGWASGPTNGVCVRTHTPTGGDYTTWDSDFLKAFKCLFSTKDRYNFLPDSGTSGNQVVPLKSMLADYVAPIAVKPCRFDVPSTKHAPMICSISPGLGMEPFVQAVKSPTKQDPSHVDYYLYPGGTAANTFMDVGVLYPFRQVDKTLSTFRISVDLYYYVFDNKVDNSGLNGLNPSSAAILNPVAKALNKMYYRSADASFAVSDPTSEQGCFQIHQVPFSTKTKPARILISDGNYKDSTQFRVAIVPFISLYGNNGVLYDYAPCVGVYSSSRGTVVQDRQVAPKLYFQTAIFGQTQVGSQAFDNYQTLVCPDPRFNHAAANWVAQAGAMTASAFVTLAHKFCDKNGADLDIFMGYSGTGVLQSPGEIGFLIRPYHDFPQTAYGQYTEAYQAGTVNPVDKDHFYQTVRIFSHGSTYPADPVYDYFTADDPNVAEVPGARINPNSNIPDILQAAIDCVPVDYATAYQNELLTGKPTTTAVTFDDGSTLSKKTWTSFKEWWLRKMAAAQTCMRSGISNVYAGRETLADGTKWNWYDNSDKGFSDDQVFSVDRKMLYSFSLDSFSDHQQQLFIYLLQAEATSAGTASGARSLAGGRAVAVVRRDPLFSPTNTVAVPIHPTQVLLYRQLGD